MVPRLPHKTSATRIGEEIKKMYKEIKQKKREKKNKNKKNNPKTIHLTTCQQCPSAPKSLHCSSAHPSLTHRWVVIVGMHWLQKRYANQNVWSIPFPHFFPKLNPPSMANSRAGMVSICSTLSMAGLFCHLCGHLCREKIKRSVNSCVFIDHHPLLSLN